ncbi:MAG: membrane metalloprotease [Candidatus Ozemobacter sibiricus]|uniref:Membrane metalloprotease n=1 Tax=Candidatus Ozemobacter sibiricus TaxID=2268124 RepID=A0A367ZTB1_9BACT|nr:MAG: membrane metalloprotease [Candidatus Ozemobacter sibiricus]
MWLANALLMGPGLFLWKVLHFLLYAPLLLFSLAFHEYAHAAMADFLGDPTPRRQGRLSLNPLAHLDPVGTLMLVFSNFGWARPVVVDPSSFRIPSRAMMSVALAGPLSNLLLAVIGGALLKGMISLHLMWGLPALPLDILAKALQTFILVNLALACFNLLPLPPLDGSRVLRYFLPRQHAPLMRTLDDIGPLLLILAVSLGLLDPVLGPMMTVSYEGILRLYGLM